MNQVVVYKGQDGMLAIVFPSGELPVEEVAKKDVPPGVPYLIVDAATLPPDWDYSAAWEADFSQPHGHGMGHDAWKAQYVDPFDFDMHTQAHCENAQFDMMQALKKAPQTFTSAP